MRIDEVQTHDHEKWWNARWQLAQWKDDSLDPVKNIVRAVFKMLMLYSCGWVPFVSWQPILLDSVRTWLPECRHRMYANNRITANYHSWIATGNLANNVPMLELHSDTCRRHYTRRYPQHQHVLVYTVSIIQSVSWHTTMGVDWNQCPTLTASRPGCIPAYSA